MLSLGLMSGKLTVQAALVVPPLTPGLKPVTGVTQDAVGTAVASANVAALQQTTNIPVATGVVSDGSGNYTINVDSGYGAVYLKCDKAGSPNIQGVSDVFTPT